MDMNEQFLRRGTKNEKKNCQSKLRHFEYDTQTFNNFWIMFEMHSRDIVQKNQFYITQPNSLSWPFTVRNTLYYSGLILSNLCALIDFKKNYITIASYLFDQIPSCVIGNWFLIKFVNEVNHFWKAVAKL